VIPPGVLIASGRDADIYDYGPGLVLRRARSGRSMEIEARTMEYVRSHGYPVPAVESISDDGTDLVMERIDGMSMIDELTRRPWTVPRQAKVLADLHRRLHLIPAPDWLRPAPSGTGTSLLHLDLHPLNVMVTSSGPVVIDWPNAARGNGDTDVALTWALLSAGAIPVGRIRAAVLGLGRRLLVRSFIGGFDVDAVCAELPAAVEWKTRDANLSEAERAVMRTLASRYG
jgi:aminoglycoside phosphotransferase (APT) family kinase protein